MPLWRLPATTQVTPQQWGVFTVTKAGRTAKTPTVVESDYSAALLKALALNRQSPAKTFRVVRLD
jgi:hypothetical protein